MTERDRLKQEAEKFPEKWSACKQLGNKVTREMGKAIRDFYQDLINENMWDPKRMWKSINKVLRRWGFREAFKYCRSRL